ncbi:MAG: apolipoprotein N-acyltransferase [Pseudomonadota bacterium]|nr:apolipoprotein N-acyltransferase [Pseudomonadota bacterium]
MSIAISNLHSNFSKTKYNIYYHYFKYFLTITLSAFLMSYSLYSESTLVALFALFSFMYLFTIPLSFLSQLLTYSLFFIFFLSHSSYWLVYCLSDFSGLSFSLSVCFLFLVFIPFSIIMSLPCFLFQRFNNKYKFFYSLSFFLILFDYLRMHSFLAAPWLFYGTIPMNFSFFKLFYSYGGVFFTGYVCLRTFEVLVNVINGRIDKDGRYLLLFFVFSSVSLASLYVFSLLSPHSGPATKPLRINLIQPNFSHLELRDPMIDWQTSLHLLSLNQKSSHYVNVLPEGILSLSKSQLSLSDLEKSQFLQNSILGLNYFSDSGFNPLLIGTNQVHGRYVKQHLVPFGEYLPFSNLLKPYIAYFDNHRTAAGNRSAFSLLTYSGFKLYPLICYDLFFPLNHKSFIHSSDAIIAIAENTWYRDSVFQRLFLKAAKIRALEAQTPLLLDMNRGHTSHIDQYGRVESSLPYDTRSTLNTTVYKKNQQYPPFYSYLSDGFIVFLLFLFETTTLVYFNILFKRDNHLNKT